ncbi:MAG: DUF2442 domain-containing protein [Acidobacteria bacterium]|nr:DUF2442 domain-containing protein [Acidobacteriota bacterium]
MSGAAEREFATALEALAEGLRITTRTGKAVISWEACGERVRRASQQDRLAVRLSPSGYGVYWPLLDEDVTVAGLLHGFAGHSGGDDHAEDEADGSDGEGGPLDGGALEGLIDGGAEAGDSDDEAGDGGVVARGHAKAIVADRGWGALWKSVCGGAFRTRRW